MRLLQAAFLFLFTAVAHAGWLETDGSRFCCSKRFADCEQNCRASCLGRADCEPKPGCVADCRKQHCRKDAVTCEDAASPQKRPDMSLRHDGRVLSPGTVAFEITREGGPKRRDLSIYGILYCRKKDTSIEVLKKTMTYPVIPGEATRFEIAVSPESFKEWSLRCGELTVAIALPSEEDRTAWSYHNLLTQADADRARKGDMRVKGRFEWK